MWDYVGVVLGSSWVALGSSWRYLGVILGYSWCQCGVVVGSVWDKFEVKLVSKTKQVSKSN